jgi:hypothetical protein
MHIEKHGMLKTVLTQQSSTHIANTSFGLNHASGSNPASQSSKAMLKPCVITTTKPCHNLALVLQTIKIVGTSAAPQHICNTTAANRYFLLPVCP